MHRNTVSDEKALLRTRVAELEGVIREVMSNRHTSLCHSIAF